MKKSFPITQKQFYEWLAAKPKAKCDNACRQGCPIVNAVFELTGIRLRSIELVLSSNPRWVYTLVEKIDNLPLSWTRTRGYLLGRLTGKENP